MLFINIPELVVGINKEKIRENWISRKIMLYHVYYRILVILGLDQRLIYRELLNQA